MQAATAKNQKVIFGGGAGEMIALESTEVARHIQATTIRALLAEIHQVQYIRPLSLPQRLTGVGRLPHRLES